MATEDTGLYTADGQRIVKDEETPLAAETRFDQFINVMKEKHPLQWLNMMATNIDMLIKEYNEIAFGLGETIIAAVFVDHQEKEYEMYREILTSAEEAQKNVKDKDIC